MDDETIEPAEPTPPDASSEQPTLPAELVSSDSPADLAAAVAPYLLSFGPRVLTMSEQPTAWPVFLDRLLEALRKQPSQTYYDPL